MKIIAFSLILMASAQTASAAERPFPWPNGTQAAVSLAYDDAVNSQLDNAIPALNKYGLKGSFYLTLSSETVSKRMSEWRAAAAKGHELGNHTLFHQCSRQAPGREWVTPDNDLDQTSATQLAAQIRVGNTMLHAMDGQGARTFTVPCGDLNAGGKPYLPGIESDFVAIKSGGGAVIPDMWTLDPYSVPVTVPADVTGKQLIEWVDAAAAQGTMINFTFHGIGGDHLSVSSAAHEELLAYLAAHRDIFWTDTFIDIMKYVKLQQKDAHPHL
jgi:peptidoglycan/xylan/chitin deacetylase (PgdA/CDA1 family)